MTTNFLGAAFLFVAMSSLGCSSTSTNATATTGAAGAPAPTTANAAARDARPTTAAVSRPIYHVHLPGIGGPTFVHHWWLAEVRHALPQPCEAQIFDWTCGDPFIHALQAYDRNRSEAQRLADQIVALHAREPETRIVVTAESGGCAPAVWMLEDLPTDLVVDSLVLISPALSDGYDLSAALRHVRGNAYVFVSHGDDFILGWGTRTFGTSDGLHADAAGRDGFSVPLGADPTMYAKLVQLPYRSEWSRYWNFGGHAQAMSPLFGKNVIAPMIAKAIAGA